MGGLSNRDSGILGIGTPTAPIPPATGMRVIKSGRSTEITEGIISSVTGGKVEITLRPGYPDAYALSEPGDSGAVWLDRSTLAHRHVSAMDDTALVLQTRSGTL